jgi:hypothetical protein
MASPAAADPTARSTPEPLPISRGWKGWALIGACFVLGYGISQRLVSIRLEGGLSGAQRFEVKSFPGTELDSLRRRFGDASTQIRGDLDLQELELQRQKDAASIEQRRVEIEQREQEQPSGDAGNGSTSPSAAEATGGPAPLPEAPVLPPPSEPEPSAPQAPPAAPAAPGTTP